MKRLSFLVLPLITAPAFADTARQLEAHVHGTGALNIAIEGQTVAMEFHAPGADIVGFEYAPKSAEDRAAVDAAVATLARPLDLFGLPTQAACVVTQASAELELESEHDDHGHDDHAHDHNHEEEAAGHSEFHAEYTLTCDAPEEMTQIVFTYFETFPNALEVDVKIITETGARAFSVTREASVLSLEGMF